MLPIIGIIAGNGDLPKEIADIYQKNGGRCIIADIGAEERLFPCTKGKFPLGSVGAILSFFRKNSVESVILVGGIDRVDLKSLKVDMQGAILISKIAKNKLLGDDNILRIVAEHIESKGFKVISPQEILKLNHFPDNFTLISKTSTQDEIDIQIGRKVLSSLGENDVGQSVIVCNGYVLGIEAAEGTDNLIKRCADLRKSTKGGLLVKMSKCAQDNRLDVPSIGPGTIRRLAEKNYSGLAIEDKKVIIIKPQETFDLLNLYQLFLKII